MVWEGLNVVTVGRKMLGATDPAKSEPGTIRGDFGIVTGRYAKIIESALFFVSMVYFILILMLIYIRDFEIIKVQQQYSDFSYILGQIRNIF